MLTYVDTLRTSRAQLLATAIDTGSGPNATLTVYTGTRPAPGAAITDQLALVVLKFTHPCAKTVSGGVLTLKPLAEQMATAAMLDAPESTRAFEAEMKRKVKARLDALYEGVRSRIAQAIQDGFVVKRLIARLDPLFEQLNTALDTGLDPNTIIRQIGAALPGLSLEMQTTLGPILAQLNASIPQLTNAVTGNTAALKEVQFSQTTVVQSSPSLRLDSPYRAMFARFS